MTRQELDAALESFYRDAARSLSAIHAFRSWAVPVFKHHNARPPRKCRRHNARKRARFFQALGRWHIIPLYDPEPDGA